MLVLLVVNIGAVLLWRQQAGTVLQARLEALRQGNRDLVRLREENSRLTAAQVTSEELDTLQTDQPPAPSLHRNIEASKRVVQNHLQNQKAAAAWAEKVAAAESGSEAITVETGMVPISTLKNAGCSTPVATLETALWAAAGGDISVFSKTLTIMPPVRREIEDIIAQLPEADRRKFDSAKRFIAFMTVHDVPLGEAHILGISQETDGRTRVVAILRDRNGGRRVAAFVRREGNEWRLVVPLGAVEKYAARLKGSPSPSVK
jgi:hypothetical protein